MNTKNFLHSTAGQNTPTPAVNSALCVLGYRYVSHAANDVVVVANNIHPRTQHPKTMKNLLALTEVDSCEIISKKGYFLRFSGLILLIFLTGCARQNPVERLIFSTKDGVSFFYESLNSNLISSQNVYLNHLDMEVKFEEDADWVEISLNEDQSLRFWTVLKQIRFLDENELRERDKSLKEHLGYMPNISMPVCFCRMSIPVRFPKGG
jgi:hypothetical protein